LCWRGRKTLLNQPIEFILNTLCSEIL